MTYTIARRLEEIESTLAQLRAESDGRGTSLYLVGKLMAQLGTLRSDLVRHPEPATSRADT